MITTHVNATQNAHIKAHGAPQQWQHELVHLIGGKRQLSLRNTHAYSLYERLCRTVFFEEVGRWCGLSLPHVAVPAYDTIYVFFLSVSVVVLSVVPFVAPFTVLSGRVQNRIVSEYDCPQRGPDYPHNYPVEPTLGLPSSGATALYVIWGPI